MELSDRVRSGPSSPAETEEFPPPEVSFVRPGVPQPAWGRPCPCREPGGCQGRHDGQPRHGPRHDGGDGGGSQPGPGLRARAQPETTDIRDVEPGRGRQTWWPPDRGRPRGGWRSHASTASQASASSSSFQVPRHDPIQVHHASVHGRHGAARRSASTVQQEIWRSPRTGGAGTETQP